MTRTFGLHLLTRGMQLRVWRLLAALLSVGVLCAVVVTALAFSAGMRGSLEQELSAYGANVIVTGRHTDLPQALVHTLAEREDVAVAAGQLYAAGRVSGIQVEVIGLQEPPPGVRLSGTWPAANQVSVGADLVEALALGEADEVTLTFGGTPSTLSVAARHEVGGPEDRAVLLPLETLQQLVGQSERVSAVMLRVPSADATGIAAAIEAAHPQARARSVAQLANAEVALVANVEWLLFLSSAVVAFGCAVATWATMGAMILARRGELGLMRALGATRGTLAGLVLAESGAVGLLGGLCGFALGTVLGRLVWTGDAFAAPAPSLALLAISALIGLAVALAASALPLARALQNIPAVLLRAP